MRAIDVDEYRDMNITVVVNYAEEPIVGELIAVATPVREDPIGSHTAAVVQIPDGSFVLIAVDCIDDITRT